MQIGKCDEDLNLADRPTPLDGMNAGGFSVVVSCVTRWTANPDDPWCMMSPLQICIL